MSQILREKGGSIISVAGGASLRDAASLLANNNIGAVLILNENGSPAGILSERDIVRAIAREGDVALFFIVATCMSTPVATCTGSDTAEDLMEQMTQGRFRHVPVVEDGRVAGLVSIGDVVKARIGETTYEASALKSYIAAR